MEFTFTTAGRVVFGPGTVAQLPDLAAGFGRRVVVVTGRHGADLPVIEALGAERLHVIAPGEPTVPQVEEALLKARQLRPDVVVALGGGAAIDTAKAIGIMLGNDGPDDTVPDRTAPERTVLDHLEVVGKGVPLAPRSVPVIACPTTSGAGAEVTANAPIISPEHHYKASLRSPAMMPAIALVDPELTVGCPRSVTASSGFDALTQNIEPYVSHRANPLTDQLSTEGMRRAASGLRRAWTDGSDLEARTDMSLCSLLGGMSLVNAKLGAAHGLAAPLGGLLGAAHGTICAAVLAASMRVNVESMRRRDPDNPALARYDEIGRVLTGDGAATAMDGVEWVSALTAVLEVPGLDALGLRSDAVDELADAAAGASSMKGNPIVLTHDEIVRIIELSM